MARLPPAVDAVAADVVGGLGRVGVGVRPVQPRRFEVAVVVHAARLELLEDRGGRRLARDLGDDLVGDGGVQHSLCNVELHLFGAVLGPVCNTKIKYRKVRYMTTFGR